MSEHHTLHSTLPSFTPVPRAKDRSNGWKPQVQQAFIEALAETGSVRAACRRVGRSDHGAYHLRRHPEAGEFRRAWDAALDLGVRRIEDAAMDRALYGTEETIHYHGDHIATRRRYNERLVMFILRNRAADRFGEHGAKGPDAIGRMELERYRKQWRQEWEAEAQANGPTPAEVRASIARKVDALRIEVHARRRREWMKLSAETRRAFANYEELRARDLDRAIDIPDYLRPEPGEPPREPWWEVPDAQLAADAALPDDVLAALPAPEEEADEPRPEPDRSASEPQGPRVIGLKDEGF